MWRKKQPQGWRAGEMGSGSINPERETKLGLNLSVSNHNHHRCLETLVPKIKVLQASWHPASLKMKWKKNKDIANTLGKKRLLYQERTQILESTEEQGSRSKPRRSHLPNPTLSLWFSGIWTSQVFLISHPFPSYTIFLEASLGPRVLPWAIFHLWSPEGKAVWATVTRQHGAPLQSGFSRPHKGNCFRAELHAC